MEDYCYANQNCFVIVVVHIPKFPVTKLDSFTIWHMSSSSSSFSGKTLNWFSVFPFACLFFWGYGGSSSSWDLQEF